MRRADSGSGKWIADFHEGSEKVPFDAFFKGSRYAWLDEEGRPTLDLDGENEKHLEGEVAACFERDLEEEKEGLVKDLEGLMEAEEKKGLEPEAAQGEEARPTPEAVTPRRRCPGGHEMVLVRVGGAGLLCDGGCGRGIRRGGEWWSCEECDLDMCMACCREDEGGMAIDAIDAIDA